MGIILIIYFILVIIIAIISSLKTKNVDDYVLGNKKISGIALALSERATGESAWLLLGLTGEAYLLGIQAVWIALGCILGVVFIWFVMANKLQKLTDDTKALTLSSLISKQFPGYEKHTWNIFSNDCCFFLYLLYCSTIYRRRQNTT